MPDPGKSGEVCTECGYKFNVGEFILCPNNTTRKLCYFCSYDRLKVPYDRLKVTAVALQQAIQAKDEAIAQLDAKLFTMSADAKGTAAESKSKVQALVQQVKEKD